MDRTTSKCNVSKKQMKHPLDRQDGERTHVHMIIIIIISSSITVVIILIDECLNETISLLKALISYVALTKITVDSTSFTMVDSFPLSVYCHSVHFTASPLVCV